MESIKDIQNRLEGLEDIKHLLRSIRAMSAIRWRRAKKHLQIAQTYAGYVDSQLSTVWLKTGSEITDEPVNIRGGKSQVGLITLTSDRGLCGNFNTGLVSKALFVEGILNKKNKEMKIISLGGYGERMFKNAGYEIFFSEKMPGSQGISFVNIRKVTSHIRALYESGSINELNILYNQFNYFGSYTPKSIQILPPRFSKIILKTKQVPEALIINPGPEELKILPIVGAPGCQPFPGLYRIDGQ